MAERAFIRLRRFAVDLNQPTADNPIRESLAPLGEKVTETELLGLLSGAHSKEESIARGLMLIETRPGLRARSTTSPEPSPTRSRSGCARTRNCWSS